MQSLQIMEGLIGTACAAACLYYARHGALATQPQSPPHAVPWHSALGEYARKNPFAAVFGALALGFLVSSWGMYVSPRALPLPARTVEKWRVVTRNVPTPDPAQTARIVALQTTINADGATITSQKTEIDRLKLLLGKSTFARNSARRATLRPAALAEAPAAPTEVRENTIAPAETAATANPHPYSEGVAPVANTGAAATPTQAVQGNATAPANGSAGNANAAPATSASTPPH